MIKSDRMERCGIMLFDSIRNKVQYERDKWRRARNQRAVKNCTAWQNVATMEQTLEQLMRTECSLCRYGDGEYKVMAGLSNGFQQEDKALARRLRQVLQSEEPGLLVCIPNITDDMSLRTVEAADFWRWCIREWGGDFASFLKADKTYYNAHVTRLYMAYQACGRSAKWFKMLKQVWKDRPLLIVEGEKTRLGVGNDLFDGARSVHRIICPSKSAFSCYQEIINTVKNVWNGELVLIALGQTATVLAHDLHREGIRALDIGHIDIEYEWFLAGATKKNAVAGKFVKEVDDQLSGVSDQQYEGQIVAKVGV